jgi:ATP-dependent Clp protease, protease subunit
MKNLPPWIKVKAAKAGPVEILIHGRIGESYYSEGSVTEQQITDALAEIKPGTPITVGINTPGGSVADGLAIYNALNRRASDVTTRNDGYAVSTGSMLMMAGSKAVSPKSSVWMIHDPWMGTQGDADDHRKSAEMLDVHADVMVGIYSQKTGKPPEVIRAAMKAETWFKGEDAVSYGLADETGDTDVGPLDALDVAAFANVPAFVLAAVSKPKTPAVTGGATQGEIMNRTQIIALLKKHGIVVADDISDDLLKAKMDEVLAAKAEPVKTTVEDSNIVDLRKQIHAERSARITAEFDRLAATRPSVIRADMLPKVLADESLMAFVRAIPEAGASPINLGASDKGNSLIEAYSAMKPGADRETFRVENHTALVEARERHLGSVQAANTLASGLVTDYLSDAMIKVANNRLAALQYFTTGFSMDPMKPRATVQIRKATTGSAVQTNPTNFETGDTTLAAVPVTVNQISKSFQITNDELHKGFQLAHLAGVNADLFANAISDVWTALILVGTYGAGQVVGAASTMTVAKLSATMLTAKNYPQKNLLLDGGHLAYLLPADKTKYVLGERGAYGFDFIVAQNRWTNATANTVGFVCSPEALAVVSGLPMVAPAGEMLSVGNIALPDINMTVQSNSWFSRAGRVYWASLDVMFGAAALDTTVGNQLITA